MSGRYIDADAFAREMYHEAFETDTDMQRWDSGCWIRYKLFEEILKKQPTADVRENVHGKWRRDFSGNEFYWYCTNCKEEYYEDDLYMGGNEFPDFCPNCGSDMSKGENKWKI